MRGSRFVMLVGVCLVRVIVPGSVYEAGVVPAAQSYVGMAAYLPCNALANQLTRSSLSLGGGHPPRLTLKQLYQGYPRIATGFAAGTVLQTYAHLQLQAYAKRVSSEQLSAASPLLAGVLASPFSAGWESYAARQGHLNNSYMLKIAGITLGPIAVREAIFTYAYIKAAGSLRACLVSRLGVADAPAALVGGAFAGAVAAVVSQPISELIRVVQNAPEPVRVRHAARLLVKRVSDARSIKPLYLTALPRTVGMMGAVAGMDLVGTLLDRQA